MHYISLFVILFRVRVRGWWSDRVPYYLEVHDSHSKEDFMMVDMHPKASHVECLSVDALT